MVLILKVIAIAVTAVIAFFIFYNILKITLEIRKMNKEIEEDDKRMETVFKEMEEDHKKGYKPLEGRAKDVFTGTFCAKDS